MSIYNEFDGKFILEKKKYMPSFYTKNEQSLNELMSIVLWAKTFKEAMFCFINEIQECPKCENCGGNSKFVGAPKYGQYNRFCPKKECFLASASLSGSRESQEKSKKTCMERFGVDNPAKRPEYLELRNKTLDQKYGKDYLKIIRDNREKTCQEKYGVKNAMMLDEFKQKRKNVWTEKYGVDNPMKCDSVKEKRIQTWLQNYGEEHHFKVYGIREKYKNTCMERFGVECPLQSPVVWEKIRNTLYSKYGVYHNMQSPETCEKANSSNFRTYISESGKEYLLQGYEHFMVDVLENLGVSFVNSRKDVGTIKYTWDGINKYYFPDFRLDNGSYVEVKSRYTYEKDKEKIRNIKNSNPSIKLIVFIFNSDGSIDEVIE